MAEKEKIGLKSSYLESAEYDKEDASMVISFRAGSQIKYMDVSGGTWEAFKAADNHGVYYANLIKGSFQSVPIVSKKIGQPTNTQRRVKPHVNRESGSRIRPIGTVQRAIDGARQR